MAMSPVLLRPRRKVTATAGLTAPSGVTLTTAPAAPADITLATAPLPPSGVMLTPQPTDPYFSDVTLLLQDSLADESLSGATVTAVGTTALTTTAKVGSHAFSFPANADRLEAICGPIGTSDYTVEFWLYLTELPTGSSGTATAPIFEANPDVTNASAASDCFGLRAELSGGAYRLHCYRHSASASIVGDLPSGGLNTWRHVALCRDSSETRIYADGVEIGAGTAQNGLDWTSSQLVLSAGETGTGAWGAKCLMDGIRVTIGTARYTASFTPPTQTFPS